MGLAMTFTVTIDRDEDGVWVVECPAIPGCFSQGKTKDEALANVKGAIKTCLEVWIEQGLPLTIETEQVEIDDSSPSSAPSSDWHQSIQQTWGLWRDRDDLPDFEELRRGWDRSGRA